jgi:hypothetical protein
MKQALAAIGVVLVALVACGPSAKQVGAAREARYSADPATIFELAEAAAKDGYHKILQADVMAGVFITQGKWYSPDGQSESAGVGDAVQVEDGSLYVQLLVKVARVDATAVTVTVTPVVERFRMGASQHEKLAPDDPSLPGWVQGKADALAVAIYDRAKPYVGAPAAPAAAPAAQ